MKSLKDKLSGALGVVGLVIWYLISAIVVFTPLAFLDLSFIVYGIIIFAIISFSLIGGIVELVIWIWSFIVVVSEPIDGWSVFYFIAFAIYCLTTLLPFVISLIASLFNND